MSHTYIPAAVRRRVAERAAGRCEYCRVPAKLAFASLEIDHVISEKHGGASGLVNLAFSCALCNKAKGSDIASVDPMTDQIVPLFNPRRDDWELHFDLLPDGTITGKTPSGRATVRLLRIDSPDRIRERRLLFDIGELVR